MNRSPKKTREMKSISTTDPEMVKRSSILARGMAVIFLFLILHILIIHKDETLTSCRQKRIDLLAELRGCRQIKLHDLHDAYVAISLYRTNVRVDRPVGKFAPFNGKFLDIIFSAVYALSELSHLPHILSQDPTRAPRARNEKFLLSQMRNVK